MNYEQIKQQVLGTSSNLSSIPVQVIKYLLPINWHSFMVEGVDGTRLPDIEHDRIRTITHIGGYLLKGKWFPYKVCTVMVDGVPAFFFDHVVEGEATSNVYVLSDYWVKVLLRCLMEEVLRSMTYALPYMAERVDEGDEVELDYRIVEGLAYDMEPPKYEYW